MLDNSRKPLVSIACGGTGGHLFPGLAVGQEFLHRGCDVLLLISQKEVDQQGAKSAAGMEVVTLPAIGPIRSTRDPGVVQATIEAPWRRQVREFVGWQG